MSGAMKLGGTVLAKVAANYAPWLVSQATSIISTCAVQTTIKVGSFAVQAYQVEEQARGVYNSATKAVDSFNKGDTEEGIRALVDTGIGGFSLTSSLKSFIGTLNEIRKKGIIGFFKSCFAGGTPLRTPEGSKFIEEFQPGDLILARDEFDPDGPVEVKVVEKVFSRTGRILALHIGGEVIETTAEHPFYVQGAGWKSAGELAPGDLLRTLEDGWQAVQEVNDTEVYETVYNLRVSEYHTYFIGCKEWDFSVWAHNESCEVYKTSKAEEDAEELDAIRRGLKAKDPKAIDYSTKRPKPAASDIPDDPAATRPGLRKSTRERAQAAAEKTPEGDYIEPNTGKIVPKECPFDYGHPKNEEWWRTRDQARRENWTRRQVIEHENAKTFQIEDLSSNRSHQFEEP